MGFYKKIILLLIFISVLPIFPIKLCLAQEDPSLFIHEQQEIKQKFYLNNRGTEVIDDANLMISAKEAEQDHIIAQKIIFLIDILVTKEVEKENLEKQNRALTQKMLSLVSEKQAVKESLTKENQALTQRIASLANILAEKEVEKESLTKENQALAQEMNSLIDKISEKEAGKNNPGLKKKVSDFLMDLSKKEMKEKEALRSEIINLKKTLNDERAILYEKIGIAYTQAKMYNEAMNAYEKALAYNPNNPNICYYLGLLSKYEEKNPKKAVQYLRRYITLAPRGEYVKKAQELIKMLE